MGTFRIEIQGVGPHGCDRGVKDGLTVAGCGSAQCVDCITRNFVQMLQKVANVSFNYASSDRNTDSYARLTHWPGQVSQVVDDLLTRIRRGNF